MVKIGIILADSAPEKWGGADNFDEFFLKRFVENSSKHISYELIHAINGCLPKDEDIPSYTGFIISGSRHSVNDDDQWVHRLREFVRGLYHIINRRKPKLFGMCFGHQLIATALGGETNMNLNDKYIIGAEAVNADKNLYEQEFYKTIFGGRNTFKIMQCHGEEVTVLPNDAIVLGESITCRYEILRYGDHILSTQGHPEFTETCMKETLLPAVTVAKGLTDKEVEEATDAFPYAETDTLVQFVVSFLTQQS